MKAIKDAITAKTIPPKTDREILDEVLKRTNRGHIAGVGNEITRWWDITYIEADSYEDWLNWLVNLAFFMYKQALRRVFFVMYGGMFGNSDSISLEADSSPKAMIFENIVNLAGTGNLDFGRSQPDQGYCTREQLEDMKRQHALKKEEQRKAFKMFRGSISTPSGPSSTSPAPNSTPLGLGDCYTPTFDHETRQSNEQDDNDSDDGNREYDVDIYDDE
ncbi:hypothetical protein Tco_1475904 [Tanacetum coccineum]